MTEKEDLFRGMAPQPPQSLSLKLRPRTLDEFVGQSHLLSEGKPLRRIIEKKIPVSMIFTGPPGCGKTTLANIIIENINAEVVRLNAVMARVEDIRSVRKQAEEKWSLYQKKTFLFVDEIHRFNKAQQDAFLDDLEQGRYHLIGATTLNPAFYLTPPLLSRCLVFRFEALIQNEILVILERALKQLGIEFPQESLRLIAQRSHGDARIALNLLELSLTMGVSEPEKLEKEIFSLHTVRYNRDGDDHYDVISAFIKSLRGSDPDAALYWLARMLEGGEDPRFITRRMMIFASEDIGNADPQALLVAVAAAQAVEMVGLPEARINLAQAVTYLATAPKSNASYLGIEKATEEVKRNPQEVPKHLRTSDFFSEKQTPYRYPHQHPDHFVLQEYYQKRERLYEPSDQGYEREIKERLKRWWGTENP